MRRTEREITDRAQLDDILQRGKVICLGLMDFDQSYVVPLNFGYDGDAIYIHSAGEGHKMELLRANPKVSFAVTVDEAVIPGEIGCKWSSRYRSVMGRGTASFVEDRESKIRALDTMMAKFTEGPFEYIEETLGRTVVVRIDIDKITGKQAGY
jgi:uncharacterized protein